MTPVRPSTDRGVWMYTALLGVATGLVAAQLSTDVEDESSTADEAVAAVAHAWILVLFVVLFVSLLAAVYAQPSWLMDLVVRHSHPCVLWCASTSSRVCSLTIDDAPSPSTPQILDLLRDHGVKATFFIISGHIAGNEDVVRRIVREGHRLGNHLTEDRASILDELHVFEHKLRECDAAIAVYQPLGDSDASHENSDDAELLPATATVTTRLIPATTVSPSASVVSKWLRPASGWFTSNMREIVQSHGYKICMGSVYPHDAQIKIQWVNSLFLKLRTRPGSVLIVHDRPWTVGVLREALPALTAKFKFVGLDELHSHHHNSNLHAHSHKVKSMK